MLLILVNYSGDVFIAAGRPFVGSWLEKYEIYGTRVDKWKPMLFRKISEDQLAPKYGGTNPDWKPISFK